MTRSNGRKFVSAPRIRLNASLRLRLDPGEASAASGFAVFQRDFGELGPAVILAPVRKVRVRERRAAPHPMTPLFPPFPWMPAQQRLARWQANAGAGVLNL